ncbi:hypothetical protein V9T40_006438 [Parthenolecanium corni]|uniref:Ras-like GTP-binding protein RhoL n=1 Tax=Parthenolecanium corni TaxID=536013 RepID=A0AAN9Y7E5_9HEMI
MRLPSSGFRRRERRKGVPEDALVTCHPAVDSDKKMPEEGFKNGNGIANGIIRPTNGIISNRELKITAVGDGMVGKTCLLITYTSHSFPKDYVPTVFDNYPTIIEVDDVKHNVTLWDTAGQEDYERLRPLSYPSTDCFLLCYSINNKSSFDNIFLKWYPELRHHCPNVPIILIATKSDLRGTDETLISVSEGKRMKKSIRAVKYMECSALKNEGLNEIFAEAVRCVYRKQPITKRICTLL